MIETPVLMKDLESKQLILKISGEVKDCNIGLFEAQAKSILSSINTNLITDEDFAEAKENIKSCKLIETRIANAKQQSIMSMEDVAAVMKTVDTVQAEFAKIRLQLDKAVKERTTARKNEILNNGIRKIENAWHISPVKHGFAIDTNSIVGAIKGKSLFSKMEEAVEVEVQIQIEKLENIESVFSENLAQIGKAESEYPGLFPDKKQIALQPVDNVSLLITARVEKNKNDIRAIADKKVENDKNAEEVKVEPQIEPVKNIIPPPPPFYVKDPPKTNSRVIRVIISTENESNTIADILFVDGVLGLQGELND